MRRHGVEAARKQYTMRLAVAELITITLPEKRRNMRMVEQEIAEAMEAARAKRDDTRTCGR